MDSLLTAQGHRVYRVTLTGLGERVHLASPSIGLTTHIADVVNTISWEQLEDVVLVGHSYGGMVITGVADRIPARIRALIYVDAFLPESGESVARLTGAELAPFLHRTQRRHDRAAVGVTGKLHPEGRAAATQDIYRHARPVQYRGASPPGELHPYGRQGRHKGRLLAVRRAGQARGWPVPEWKPTYARAIRRARAGATPFAPTVIAT